MGNINKLYQETIKEELKKELKIKNSMRVPKLLKIVLNMGLNDAVNNKGVIEKVEKQMVIISGQKPLITRAKKSISAFKLRKGMPMGLKVTLRKERMFDFWEKLVKIVLPRQRDFKGVSLTGMDGRGNLNIGFKEQTIFPDLEYDQVDKIRGVEVTVVTSTISTEEAELLLKKLGMPFAAEKKENG